MTAHYNPDSLKFSVTSQLKKQGRRQPVQVVSKTTAKLNFELIFDTTTMGKGDVRQTTWKIIQMMAPEQAEAQAHGRRRAANKPIKVEFAWGSSVFLGYIDSLKENLDFFTAEGIPLRSTVNISMSEHSLSFAPLEPDEPAEAEAPLTQARPDLPLDQVAGTQGNSAATRMIGAANGLDSIRNPLDCELKITPPSLKVTPPMIQADAGFSASMSSFARLRTSTTGGMVSSGSFRVRPPAPPDLGFDSGGSRAIGADTRFQPGGRIIGEVDGNDINNPFKISFNQE